MHRTTPPDPGTDAAATAERAVEALAAAQMGVWDWDVTTGDLAWDDQIARLHGFEPADFDGTLDTFLSRIHPDDRSGVAAAIEHALGRGGSFLTEFRVARPDGTTSWIQGRGRAILDGGVPVRMIGIGADTTQLHDVRERSGRTLEHITDGVLLLDRDWRVVHANQEACRLLRRTAEALVGSDFWEQFPDAVGTEFWDRYHEAMEAQEDRTFEAYYGPLEGWFEVRAFGAPDGLTIAFRNVDDRHVAAAAREALVAELEQSLARQRQLQAVTVGLASALTVEDVGRVVLIQARQALGTLFAGVALLDRADGVLRFTSLESLPASTVRDWQVVPLDTPSALTDAVRSGRAIYHETTEALLADHPHLADTVAAVGGAAYLSAPLVLGDRTLGALSMSWSEPRTFDELDRAFIEALASQCAQAIDRAQLFARQRSVTDTLQHAVLPRSLPDLPEVGIDACYLPATTGLAIGGDWYDALELRDGRLLVAVGDVSGHGVEAAAIMGQVRNALRGFMIAGHTPAETLGLLDEVVDIAGLGLFATVIAGVFDPVTSTLVWANAGHPPLLLHAAGGPRALEGTSGAPVGVGGQQGYRDERTIIRPGDIVVGYTDGLIERRGEGLDVGLRRASEAVARHAGAAVAEGWSDRLAHDVLAGAVRQDDVCVLAIQPRTG